MTLGRGRKEKRWGGKEGIDREGSEGQSRELVRPYRLTGRWTAQGSTDCQQ